MDHIAGQRMAPKHESFTERELEAQQLTAQRYTNEVIGLQLGISDGTVWPENTVSWTAPAKWPMHC